MTHFFLCLFVIMTVSIAQAAEPSDPMLGSTHRAHTRPAPDLLSGAAPATTEAASTHAGATTVDPGLCRALVNHTPNADVAYQSGVGAQGKAVAPADLPGATQIQMPQKLTIPLTLGLAQSLHMDPTSYPSNQFGAGTEALIGNLTVEGNKVSFNGQPLSDTQQQNLAVLCMKPNP